MQQLTRNVFVETRSRGCNHRFVTTSEEIVIIESLHKPSDALLKPLLRSIREVRQTEGGGEIHDGITTTPASHLFFLAW